GIVEGSLTFALIAYGQSASEAVAIVLLYRIVSFWGVVPLGWLSWAYLALQQRRGRRHGKHHPWAIHHRQRPSRSERPTERRDAVLEWDYGDYEGRTNDDIRAERPGWLLWRDGCPGGERPDDVGRRADRVITTLRDATGDVILFAHGHILRVLAARWVGLAPAEGSRLALDPATISVLGYERETSVIRLWNEEPSRSAR